MTPGNPKSPDIPKSREEIIDEAFQTINTLADAIIEDDRQKLNEGLINHEPLLHTKALTTTNSSYIFTIGELLPYKRATQACFPRQYTVEVLRIMGLLPDKVVIWYGDRHGCYGIDESSSNFALRQNALVRELRLYANENQRPFSQEPIEGGFLIKVGTANTHLNLEFRVPTENGASLENYADGITFKINTSTASPAGEAAKPQPLPVLRTEKEGVADFSLYEEEVLCAEIEKIFAAASLLRRHDGYPGICIDSIVASLTDMEGFNKFSSRSIAKALLLHLGKNELIRNAIINPNSTYPQNFLSVLNILSNELFVLKDSKTTEQLLELTSRIDALYKQAKARIRSSLILGRTS